MEKFKKNDNNSDTYSGVIDPKNSKDMVKVITDGKPKDEVDRKTKFSDGFVHIGEAYPIALAAGGFGNKLINPGEPTEDSVEILASDKGMRAISIDAKYLDNLTLEYQIRYGKKGREARKLAEEVTFVNIVEQIGLLISTLSKNTQEGGVFREIDVKYPAEIACVIAAQEVEEAKKSRMFPDSLLSGWVMNVVLETMTIDERVEHIHKALKEKIKGMMEDDDKK